jgi:hypothetical protein
MRIHLFLIRTIWAVILCAAGVSLPIHAADKSIDFDNQIAPLLARHCLECHDGAAPKGGLDLSEESLLTKGGESGAAVVGGDLAASVLWQRVVSGEMPPKEKLTANEEALLKSWILQGGKWGTAAIDPYRYSSEKRAGYDWWSLKPLRKPDLPAVPSEWSARASHPIDRFVLAKLAEHKLTPSATAEPRLLVRRLAFDLTGLPPTPEDIAAFENSPTSEAYDILLTKYLNSTQYGERWARHWLDLARYGESQGFERDKLRTNSWPYRDWVIRSLNEDIPYDQFARLQIAGDLLKPNDADGITATGFLVAAPYDEVGHTQQSAAMRAVVRQDEMEDLVGTVGQTFLGLTVNCARCHDHKFDPITQAEYYQLASCLDGVRHGERKIMTDSIREQLAATRSKWQSTSEELTALETPVRERLLHERSQPGSRPAPLPIARWDFSKAEKDQPLNDQVGTLQGNARPGTKLKDGCLILDGKTGYLTSSPIPVKLRAKTLEAWVQLSTLDQSGGGVIGVQTTDGNRFDSIVFAEREPKRWMAGSEGFVRSQSFGGPEESDAATRPVHLAVVYSDDGTITAYRDGQPYGNPYDSGDVTTFEPGSAQIVIGLRHGTDGGGNRLLKGSIGITQLYDRALSPEEVAASAGRTDFVSIAELIAALSPSDRARRERLLADLAVLNVQLKQLQDSTVYACTPQAPGVTHLLKRGNPGTPGDAVAPRGLAAVSTLPSDFGLAPDAPDEARRAALANWIASRDNPLFARVIINRVWQHHFGAGLVDSPNDFGFNGTRPTHLELLDYLAGWFIENGWSLKKLHTLILTSETWKQSSGRNKENAVVDAGNQFLWRLTPHRLEAETLRDAMLSVSGQLNPQIGGPPYQDFRVFNFNSTFFEMFDPETPDAQRRTIYRTWVRSGRSSLLDALDCPDPSTTSPRRAITTTPVQSLSLLNNSFVLRMSDATARRLEADAPAGIPARIKRLFQLAYGRSPSNAEQQELSTFVEQHGLPALCRVVFNSNEFVYVE